MGDEQGVGSFGSLVGYQVRMKSKISKTTRLSFCTTGILLRILMQDPDIPHITHVFVDEGKLYPVIKSS